MYKTAQKYKMEGERAPPATHSLQLPILSALGKVPSFISKYYPYILLGTLPRGFILHKDSTDCVGLVTLGVEYPYWTEFRQGTSVAPETPMASTAGCLAVNYTCT